ncbi:ATP-binding protein [Breoghania sp. L-A4]|uniref:sensor histidine kinase n=1 Tax=Breoghania sp. L-A4 TaxID=2304600 RepID=UPI000E35AE47|nr:ATP-binding protein [Breoghania sp. L-A4]AXS42136.1 PAS domain S-box protein [Breoghania sp. L-A4]
MDGQECFYTILREAPASARFARLFERLLDQADDADIGLDQWCAIVLDLFCDYLGLEHGAVHDLRHRPEPFLLTNKILPSGPDPAAPFLDRAFCEKVAASPGVIAVSGPADGPALHVAPMGPCAAYIATRISLFAETDGLVVFYDRDRRGRPFDNLERTAMTIAGRMIAGRARKQKGWDVDARIAEQRSEIGYQSLFRAVPAMLVYRGPDGRIKDVTDLFVERFDYERAELCGMPAIDLAPESLKARADRLSKRLSQPGGAIANEPFAIIAKGGEVVDVEVSARRQSDGTVLGAVVDVSERNRMRSELERRNRELERANESLKHFTSIASHDIQEPLRKIRYFSDLLSQAVANDNRADISYSLHVLTDASQRASLLVSDLLDFSRASNKELESETIDLHELIDGVVSELRREHKELRPQFTVDAPHLLVTGDRTAIIQLFRNLLGNALKYRHPERTPEVGIVVHAAADQGQPAEIRIADNGIGFEAEYAEMILKPFTRLHRRAQYPGSGVGLAICDVVARRHNWTLRAEGRPGDGAVFTISVPAYAVVAE